MMIIRMPGRVWEDYLDPKASQMQGEIGLPNPRRVKRGKGWTAVYDDVTPEQAEEVAEYLRDRAWVLLGNEEPEYRGVHRAAMAVSQTIIADLTAEQARTP